MSQSEIERVIIPMVQSRKEEMENDPPCLYEEIKSLKNELDMSIKMLNIK